ncbi:MAG: polymer-forming cytoskeletal protein [Thermodesulfobacteriota bacterium]|nr:polymer-forming cytoskeletal protein [Thermodesulfobacteriota bacterium]
MFSSSSKKDKNPEVLTTVLGEGTEITGEMSFQGTMRIDGQFDGNLCGEHLIISAKGKVVGDVIAQSCVCYGQVDGNLTVEALHVKQGGRIDGTVSTNDLAVELGSALNGEVKPKKKELRLVQDGLDAIELQGEKGTQ